MRQYTGKEFNESGFTELKSDLRWQRTIIMRDPTLIKHVVGICLYESLIDSFFQMNKIEMEGKDFEEVSAYQAETITKCMMINLDK